MARHRPGPIMKRCRSANAMSPRKSGSRNPSARSAASASDGGASFRLERHAFDPPHLPVRVERREMMPIQRTVLLYQGAVILTHEECQSRLLARRSGTISEDLR